MRSERPERAHRRASDDYAASDGAWFRVAVGRTNNADPKWLIPLICRVGHVTKKDIGEIRIFAGNFAPNGWAFCNGQLVPISEYETLFNLIGTTYGGDGQETFGLPGAKPS